MLRSVLEDEKYTACTCKDTGEGRTKTKERTGKQEIKLERKMMEQTEFDVCRKSGRELQLQSECKGHESAVHPELRDRETIKKMHLRRVYLHLLTDVSNSDLPKHCLQPHRLQNLIAASN